MSNTKHRELIQLFVNVSYKTPTVLKYKIYREGKRFIAIRETDISERLNSS